ncbi:quinidine resistance 1 [Fusarium subglutinans]|uniref:Quinidine resistance 1 n=1 Tax=Gibberella subglutinans TaxID=42677 RepID=A0A8H5P3R4_GIBSU|nr:quinidine resistance 1 [Fusarium subglutinans]KAF5585355.1 quinidine resistance 1 [Fusarium subglutinans]
MSAMQDEAFSVYGLWPKRLMIVSVSLFALLGTMATSMYYPALPTVASDLGVSIMDVNLSVTTFMIQILQGIATPFVGSFSDSSGRRLAYVACFSIFLIANIALALQNTYTGLLVLRCVQSTGAGGLIPLASGVIADIVEPAERGSYMAWATVAPVLGPALAPVLGGALTRYLGWHSIFWFLAIACIVLGISFLFFFPETNRKLVGNGSLVPPSLSQPLYFFFMQRNKQQQGDAMERKPMSFPNPFAILKVVLDKEGAVVLADNGVINILIAGVNTGLPPLMTKLYGLSEVQKSLCFLAFGIGSAICTVITGRLMDRAYGRTAAKYNIPLKLARRDLRMPVEHARLQVTWPHIVAAIAGLLGYGWTLNRPTHLAGPMVFLFVIGYTTTAVAQALNALMVDLFPRDAATASAANNLIRCGLGAAITAAIQPMTDAVDPGWAYTICAGFLLTIVPFFIALTRFGPGWRAGRAKQDTRDQEEGGNIVQVIASREAKAS